jgi:ATP-binding cassette subfamily B protein
MFRIVITSFVIIWIDPLLILFSIIPVVVSLTFGKKLNKLRYRYNMEMQEKSRKRDYVRRVFYLTDYAKEMRLTNINRVMFRDFKCAISDLKQSIKKYGFKHGMLDYIFIASNDVVVYYGSILYAAYKTLIARTMLLGDCFIVISAINGVSWSLRGVIDSYLGFHNHSLYIENLRSFLTYTPQIQENEKGLNVPPKSTIELNDVYFRYDGQENDVLKSINLSIHQNEKIALVGHNGAGKTTLIKLLMRLYDPTEGAICLNDVPISEYRLSAYRALFGTVFQDFKIFSMSITENVLLKSDITDEERKTAQAALISSGVNEKIKTLPKGEDTILTRKFDEDGAVLSGGEYQKIAIARVFAKSSELVILDEPSSALDPISEYKMYETMLEACKDKTIIWISHRLSSAVLADTVYLLENGEIVERGTHAELLVNDKKYADMWRKQAEKYRVQEEV